MILDLRMSIELPSKTAFQPVLFHIILVDACFIVKESGSSMASYGGEAQTEVEVVPVW